MSDSFESRAMPALPATGNVRQILAAAQALAKYAFGLGTVTMVACTLVFTGMSLPPGQGLGTQIMVKASDLYLVNAFASSGESLQMCNGIR